MGNFISVVALAIFWVFKAQLFLVKIVFTYFYKCVRDLERAIRKEWSNRVIDEEKYK